MRNFAIIAASIIMAALLGMAVFHDRVGLHFVPLAKQSAPAVAGTTTATQTAAAPDADVGAGFAFRRLEIDTSKPQAESCLVFTRALDASGKTHYEDYLSVDPVMRIAVRANDYRLCMAGLEFNKTYTVTLKAGLPSAKGEKTSADETVQVELRDRPALVRFDGGILLPRENADGVPVTTVNIARLAVRVLRIGDRLLSQIETGVVDQTTLYRYDQNQLQNDQASVVWSGEMDVAAVKNEAVTTLFPIRSVLKNRAPGAYIILANDAAKPIGEFDYSTPIAEQWVIDSDIGLTTFQGGQGLSVFARGFAEARPLSAVRLTLVARNNSVLAEARTDPNGRADFDPGFFRATGSDEPVAVMAYGAGGDFTFLDLRRPVFDLTDRGVAGRAAPGPVDAFLYTERGVYRPGETVDAVAMLRDATGHAISAPLTLVLSRPDGVEFRRMAVVAASLSAGAWHWPVVLTDTAPHGRWQIAAFLDPKAAPVGRVAFDVADFVPQRLKLTLTPQEKFLTPAMDFHVRVESRFLYGAPAANLMGEGEARIGKDADPFPAFKGYAWGRDNEEFTDVVAMMKLAPTDAAGITLAEGNAGEIADTSLPLKADIKLSIDEPGGRMTTDEVMLPLHTRNLWLGLRPGFSGGSVPENTKAGFEAIAVDADGKRVAAPSLHYEFLREDTYYSWYQENGEWKYKATIRTRLIAGGALAIGAAAPAALAQTLPWGRYRLTVNDPASGASTSIGFWSGWSGSNEGERPDRVAIASDKSTYRTGETAHVNIAPQTGGKALVVIAGERIYNSRLIDVPASGASIDVPVSADWGAGAYVLVTQYRPLRDIAAHAPVRAVGVVWLGVDNAARTLTPEIAMPDKIAPRQNLTIPVSVKGLAAGEEAYVTLAAVDEGILQLTDYKTPDPADHYFGKRRLGVGMHDDYGRLIETTKAPMGVVRTGGDGFGGRPLAVVPTMTVALFTGPVKLVNGKASIAIVVPDFNGALRLMAVAWSKDKVGSTGRPMIVRDAVVGEIVLPRFLAPGDTAQAALNLHNVEGVAGNYTAIVSAGGAAAMAGETRITRTLRAGERVLVPVTLKGTAAGIANIALDLSGPNGFAVKRSWPIEVRPAQLPVSHTEVAVIRPGESWTADNALLAGITPATAKLALTISASKSYTDVVGMLRWLDEYPLSCLEQTTSRALPLLSFDTLAPDAGIPGGGALRGRLQDAVDRVLDMQSDNGSFGLWGPTGDADRWLSVYAMDFLYQAKTKKLVVADDALRRGAAMLQETAAMESADDSTRAYAFYVLAREGLANLSDLRYFADVKAPQMQTAIAPALIGDALSQAGDKARANVAFGRARSVALAAMPAIYKTDEYGSLLRDIAGATALAAEGSNPELVPALMQKSATLDMELSTTTTQEKSWMLRAAYQLAMERAPLTLTVGGTPAQPRNGAVRISPAPAQLQQGLAIANKGAAPVWRTVSVQGTADAALPVEANGLSLQKSVWTMSGQPADPSSLKQNDRVIVVLEGKMPDNFFHRLAAIDLLPAGLEIETTLSGDEGKSYPWLGMLSETGIAEARDDRYVAAFTIGSRYRTPPDPKKKPQPEPQPTFKLAYVARAVSAGQFAFPAGTVEDMYAPAIRARTALGTLSVSAP